MKRNLKVSFDVGAARYLPSDDRDLLAKLYRFLESLSAKGFRAGQEIDRFQPVRLPLAVISINDIELRPPNYLPTQVPEVSRFNFSEQHSWILARGFLRRSDPHRHHDVLVFVIAVFRRL